MTVTPLSNVKVLLDRRFKIHVYFPEMIHFCTCSEKRFLNPLSLNNV